MQNITLSITDSKEYKELFSAIRSGQTPALAVGLPPAAKAQLAAALRLETAPGLHPDRRGQCCTPTGFRPGILLRAAVCTSPHAN